MQVSGMNTGVKNSRQKEHGVNFTLYGFVKAAWQFKPILMRTFLIISIGRMFATRNMGKAAVRRL